jgi:hypothetical protein
MLTERHATNLSLADIGSCHDSDQNGPAHPISALTVLRPQLLSLRCVDMRQL